MGDIEELHQYHKTKAKEELRSRSVGVLLQIIEELESMDLSIKEIETILRTCGFNADCAVSFGAKMKYEKEAGLSHTDNTIHP